MAVGCNLIYEHVAQWLVVRKIPIKPLRGTAKLKELEKRKVDYLRDRALKQRLKEIQEYIDAPQDTERERRGSFAARRASLGLRSRRTATNTSAV